MNRKWKVTKRHMKITRNPNHDIILLIRVLL